MARFRVNRDILKKVSQVFLGMLVGAHWKESLQTAVSLGEGHITVTEVWLRVVHNVKLIYNLLFPELWQLVEAIDHYDLDITAFNPWFATWHTQQPLPFKPAELLFPAWQQLNAAKGRLRTVLFRGLWEPCHNLFETSCACKKETLYDYQNHLYSIHAWPLETVFFSASIREILDRLARFSYEAPTSACGQCQQDYKGIVARAVYRVQVYFDGLCLDCLDRSKPKTGHVDLDYWFHDKLREYEWVRGFRFPHGQPTW
ncbi:MAG: hypothetical protein Q9188_002502 [Gyalolechia gomerana]